MSIKSLFKAHGMGIFNLFLCVFAAALGADSAFAMAEVVMADPANIPVEKVEDSKGDETQMPGVGASQSEARESGFEPEEIDAAIAEFQAYATPVSASISALAEHVNVSSCEVIHYRTATPVFNVKNTTVWSTTDTGREQEIEITAGTDIDKKQARLLYECKNVYVPSVTGYDENGNPNGALALYVLLNDRASNKIKFKVLNPGATATSIPASSNMLIGAVAASESQMIVAPDNFEPVPTTVYLQKRIFNIVLTQDWINGKKKVKFAEEDLRKGALYAYKVNNEITDLLGVKTKFKVEVGNQMNDEYVYTSEGILRQVNMYYSYEDGNLKAEDLTAIAQMQFTKFSANPEAQVFCGQDFVAALLNMDLVSHKEIKFEDVEFMGMTVKGWKNNFGTLNFIYTPVFDLIGFNKCALAVDIKNSRNYVKRAAKSDTVDMTKGVGEVREAKRDIYSQIYGVALRGYNSMLIGPASEMTSAGVILQNLNVEVTSVSALPATGKAATVYYLTAASGAFAKASFVEYDVNSGSYKLYNGPLKTV